MAELLSSLIGLGKSVLSMAKDSLASHKRQKRELLHDFILEAIGQLDCLIPDSHETGTISFATIDRRIQLLQEREPDRANECGIPANKNPEREQDIREILGEMVRAGKLRRCREAGRWQISESYEGHDSGVENCC
jgi:hypothetical protein